MILMLLAVISPFVLAALVPALRRIFPRLHTGWLVLPLPAVLFAYWISLLPRIRDGTPATASVAWIPSLDVEVVLYADGLGLLFSLLITGIGTLVTLYSIFYMPKERENVGYFYVCLLLFMGAMLGVVLSDNLIAAYAFWELTSLTSFLLIAFWNHRDRSRYGAEKSLLITVMGGFAMLAGFILLYIMTGTYSIREIVRQASELPGDPLFLPAMALILLGAFTKSAQFPFHIWLPDAMEAPTPVSSYLHSATMVKAGLYLVARMTPVFGGAESWFWLVSAFGLVTLFWGGFQAFRQTDLKALLAFSTISQLGLIMCLLGLSSASLADKALEPSLYVVAGTAAVFHLLNHAAFKGALFMVVGIVDHETGTRDIRLLGGLAALMPITFTFAVIGALSMAGMPPLGGFLSKEMFFTAVLNASRMNFFSMESWGILFPVIAWTASVFTFLYSAIFVTRTFLGKLKPGHLSENPPHEAPLGLLLSPAVLAAFAVAFGFFPNVAAHHLIEPALTSMFPALLEAGGRFDVHIAFWHGWTTEWWMTLGVAAVGVLLAAASGRRLARERPLSGRFGLNALYNAALFWLERGGARLTDAYMTGSLRSYLVYIFLFLTFVVAYAFVRTGAVSFIRLDFAAYAPAGAYEIVLAAALLASTLAVPLARSRLALIILVGSIGYLVVLFFVLFRAPDLALTQMIVETVSVALFLLCFYHLPKLRKEESLVRFKLANALIALGVGTVVTLTALSVTGGDKFPSIARYFIDESYPLGGGKNIVNVILVDFRGFDTLLEITVLAIASLGIYSLIRLRGESRKNGKGGAPR